MQESIDWLSKFAARLSANYGESYSYDDLIRDLGQKNRQNRGLINRIGEDGDTFGICHLKTMWKHYKLVTENTIDLR